MFKRAYVGICDIVPTRSLYVIIVPRVEREK